MSLYDSDRRYRRRFWGGVIRLLAFMGALVVTGMVAFAWGQGDLESNVRGYQQEIFDLEKRQDALEQENANLLVAAEKAKLAVEEWRKRYDADVPTGERRRLLDLATERLEAGVDAERIAFFIQAADAPRECEGVETKRFLVRTPLYNGANTSVSFANEAILVSGTGQSAETEAGLPQAWYDPAKPVNLTFTRIDGEVFQVENMLPIQKSVLHAGVEHRFIVRAGARGFVQVAAERCAAP